MSSGSWLRAWPVTLALLLVAVGLCSWGVVDPRGLLEFAKKEGPAEWGSHLVVLLAAVAWGATAARRPVWLGIVGSAACLLILGEELDWGDRLGARMLPNALRELCGAPNLHNAWGGASYGLFAIPWVLLFGLAVLPARWLYALPAELVKRRPTVDQASAAALIGGASIIAGVAAGPTWEPVLDELAELLLYAVVLATALAQGSTQARTTPPKRVLP